MADLTVWIFAVDDEPYADENPFDSSWYSEEKAVERQEFWRARGARVGPIVKVVLPLPEALP